ncbi:hypothetical protein PHMEG_00027796 [Phytophthora megakarya]|uniref:Retrotransposon gag domain-containing protein n=1 Tax=Phytophthora megakarya TaxID=4795 RepID=A0A225V6E2_9STRA|nr:hypothetical protein PHMEG_00027796 [Phytophthora megakarya]
MAPGPPRSTLNPAAGGFNFGPHSPPAQSRRQASSRPLGSYSVSALTGSQAYVSSGQESHPHRPGPAPGPFPALPWSAPEDPSGASTAGGSGLPSTAPTWDSSFGSTNHPSSRPGASYPWGTGGPGAFGTPATGGYVPGYGVSFRPFIAYDAVEPFDTSLSLDKRHACRLSHNPGTKAWVQQLPESVRRSWRQLSDRFYKEFCRSTESPVERYLRLKQESRETPRTFLWRLNAAATKANVDYHSTSGCRRHVNQFLKNRELQLSLQIRVYFTMDELEVVLKQVEEMEQGMRRKPANDMQFGRHKPQGTGPGAPARGGSGAYAAMAAPEIPEPQVPDPGDLRWEDEDDSGYGYQYDEGNDEAYEGLFDQEEVFRAEVPGSWNDRNGRPQGRPDSRGSGHAGAPRPPVPYPVCNKLGHTRERCWQLMKCDRCGGKHPTSQCRRRECEACCQLHPAGECAVIKAFKDAAQRGQLQGLLEEVLQRLRPEATPALTIRLAG